MSTERRLILMDEFDFNYQIFKKENIKVLLDKTGLAVEASIPYMLILDIGRKDHKAVLSYLKSEGVPVDSAYYQEDNNPELVRFYW